MEKQENSESLINDLHTKTLNSSELEIKIEQLQSFMQNFDPYAQISSKDRDFLTSMNIYDLDDPFKVTNQLISCIEDLIERKQKN
tara:strand:- start:1612 stop:1866 length:255 start_codon:yes stop_codon:yes gene_type:complete